MGPVSLSARKTKVPGIGIRVSWTQSTPLPKSKLYQSFSKISNYVFVRSIVRPMALGMLVPIVIGYIVGYCVDIV